MMDIDKNTEDNDSTMMLKGQMGHRLQAGEMLNKKYRIERVLGEGGFGITYLARDTVLDMNVAVKEYYPNGYATREISRNNMVISYTGEKGEEYDRGKQRFLREARTLARLTGLQGIVGIHDFFEENGTAYIVMEYLNGITLRRYLEQMPGGKISLERTLELLRPVISSLIKVHEQGLIHRDISPDNIMVMNGKEVKLLDFGTAREVVAGPKSLSVMLKPGYAPEEQYRSHGGQGTWTDVYAVSGTIYRCITGERPVEAPDRIRKDTIQKPSEMGVDIPEETEKVLMQGLAIYSENRIQDMQILYEGLYGSYGTRGAVRAESAAKPVPPAEAAQPVKAEPSDSPEVKSAAPISDESTKIQKDSGKKTENTPAASEFTKENTSSDGGSDKSEKTGIALKPWMLPVAALLLIAVVGIAFLAGKNSGKSGEDAVVATGTTGADAETAPETKEPEQTETAAPQETADESETDVLPEGEPVVFVNPQVAKAACAALGKEEGADIYPDELPNVHALILCGERTFASWSEHEEYQNNNWEEFWNEKERSNAADLSDLSLFPNLFDLVLENQGIYDIDALKGLPLEQLSLRKNPNLRDISGLSETKTLIYLDLDSCYRLMDATPLTGLSVETLFLSNTAVKDYGFLAEMPYLDRFWGTELTTEAIDILTANKNMRYFNVCRYTEKIDVSMFKDLPLLDGLEIQEAPELTSLEGIEALRNLNFLGINNTNVKDLSPLKDLPRLDNINISYCDIDDYSVLKELPALRMITIDRSQQSAVEALGIDGLDINICN